MKKAVVIGLILMLMTPLRANAFSWGDFFRALFGISSTTSVETLKEDISNTYSTIEKELPSVETKTQGAFISVVKLLSSESDIKTVSSNLASANAKTKDNEKTEAINKVYTDYSSYLKTNKLEMVLIMKTMTEAEKETLVKNINIISEQSQKYYELKSQASSATLKAGKKAYDDSDLNKVIADANALAVQLENKSKATGTLSNQAKLLGTLAGLKF